MSGSVEAYHDMLDEKRHWERQAKIKDSGLPQDVYSRIEDLEYLTNKYRSQYSYEFGLKLNTIVNKLKEYL